MGGFRVWAQEFGVGAFGSVAVPTFLGPSLGAITTSKKPQVISNGPLKDITQASARIQLGHATLDRTTS